MVDFWPIGLEMSDTKSPREILQEAQRDWDSGSNGVLALILQYAKANSGNDLIIVHPKHLPSNRTASLFSIVYRPGNPYPARIQPKDEELPNSLKKSYYDPGFDPLSVIRSPAMMRTEGRNITNEWVADTPSEFRLKLRDAFNLGIVKSEVLNLTCAVPSLEVNDVDDSLKTEKD